MPSPAASKGNPIAAPWRAFRASYDPREFAASGGLVSGLVVLTALLGSLGLLGYLPPLARASGFRDPHVALALAAVGGAITGLAYRFEKDPTLGALFTLLDNGFYSAALAFAATHTQGGYAVGLAVTHALAAAAIPGTIYSLSVLLTFVIWLPALLFIAMFTPPLEVTIILLAGVVPFVLSSYQTGCRRRADRHLKAQEEQERHEKVRREEPLQLALTRTLLDVGHLLHELRNKQTAVAGSLHALARHADGEGPARDALDAAIAAEREQLQFVEHVLEQVKSDAESAPRPFEVAPVLKAAAGDAAGLTVNVVATDQSRHAIGDPERLRWVLANLIRNAEQAGARRVEVRTRHDGEWLEIDITDDGSGFEPAQWARLFEPFVTSGRSGGTGLGLYLCRRYVELAGGKIEGVSSGPEGTTYRIRLRSADRVAAAGAPAASGVTA